MSCSTYKRLCNNLVISSTVTFTANTLVIDIPTGVYNDNQRYCIVVAQAIPDTTTVNAPVAITIGGEATTYPLLNCDGSPVLASSINTRTRYSTRVQTSTTTGNFVLTGKLPCTRCTNNLASLPVATA